MPWVSSNVVRTVLDGSFLVLGQPFWVAAMAPPRFSRSLSYWIGALACCGWTTGLAGTCVFTGDFLVALGMVATESYVPELYQVFLGAVANIVVSILLNTVGVRLLPGINKSMVIILNSAAFYILVVLLTKTQPKATPREAFVTVINETGWSSNGLVFLLGFLPGLLTTCLPDASAHIAEEVPEPERIVPLVMFCTTLLNAISGLIMVIVLIFCTTKPENLLAPIAGQPILQIAYDAWPNKGWVITVAIILVIVNFNATISIMLGASRLIWAFAESGGIVGAKAIGATNDKLKVPVNATVLTGTLAVLLGLLVLGPSTVLNGIFGSSAVCLSITYWVSIFLMLTRGRKNLPPKRHFNLGIFGPILNIISLIWIALIIVMVCFPLYRPVTTTSMNWASVVAAAILVLTLVNWFFVNTKYITPKALYVESLHGRVAENSTP